MKRRDQCKRCRFSIPVILDGEDGELEYCCVYILRTGKRRRGGQSENDECLSFEPGTGHACYIDWLRHEATNDD